MENGSFFHKKYAVVSIPNLINDVNSYQYHRKKFDLYNFLCRITFNFFFKNKKNYYYKLFQRDIRRIEKKYRSEKNIFPIIPANPSHPQPTAPGSNQIIIHGMQDHCGRPLAQKILLICLVGIIYRQQKIFTIYIKCLYSQNTIVP